MAVYPEKRKGKFTGVWIAEVFVNGARQGRERFSSQKDAERWHDFMKVTGAPPPESRSKPKEEGPTLARVVDEFIREYNNRDPSPPRQLRYMEDLWGRDTPIAKIDERHLDMLGASLRKRPGRRRSRSTDGVTEATINRYLSTASSLFRFAKRRKYRDDLPEVQWGKEAGQRTHWLSEPEEDRVAAAMLARGWAKEEAALRILTRTGMRWGEFERLEPKDVKEGWVLLDKTKTDTPRDIPVAPWVRDKLRTFLADGGLEYHTFREHLQKALEDAGENPKVTIHCLRHTTATRLVHAGAPLPKIQQLMGHKDIQTTMRYVHVAPRSIEDLSEILSRSAGETKILPFKNVDKSSGE